MRNMLEMQNLLAVSQGPVFGGRAMRPPVVVTERTAEAAACERLACGKRRKRGGVVESTAARSDRAMKSFNTWAFKREQPSGADLLSGVVTRAVADGRPIPFVLYWGKGPRAGLAAPDMTCLDYLKSMADRIAEAHAAGAAIRLILTDTHAELNGHAAGAVDSYFGAIDAAARLRGFETIRLSEVVASARRLADIAADELPSGEILNNLVACAAKWYRGEGSTEQGAFEYFQMNMIEKRAIEMVFPDAVFVTFNSGEFRDLFPAGMPIFYMYSLRRGVGVKPWFMASETQDGSGAWPAVATAPSTSASQ